jgi:drug/metabolite transporter, DME family
VDRRACRLKNKYVVSVIFAGTLWGFMGFFRRTLDAMGISAISCIAVRCTFAAALFGIVLLISDRKAFKIKLRDAWIFVGSGVVSLLVFGLCYFKAMDYMSLSAAAILLYTAPCFVILFSAVLFKEKLTGQKLAAMLLAFAGCCLVSGIGGESRITPVGLALGITAGICYALYSIFGRFALNHGYSSLTINFYACLLAAIGATLIGGTEYVDIVTENLPNLGFASATGLITCFLPYLLYTYGLEGLENGKASITASIEPVVATVVGVVIYNESLTVSSVAGIVLVLSAIVLLNVKFKIKAKS